MALVASLQEELAALRQCVDSQARWASQHEGDEAEDEDEELGVIFAVSGALSQTLCQTTTFSQTPLVMCHAP